jgi:ParB/RepB/Spo0J family partition protein
MLQDIPVTSIRPSPSNPRKTFRHLDQLAASFTAVGQIDPVTVRPLPKEQQNGVTHELVVGERRWRAAPLAKLKTLKAIVRELDDKQVAEIQIVENDQRDDIHPLEQADGYHALEKLGYSVEQIATKVSRSTEFVRKRLKLVALIPEAKAALLAEKILPGVATLIARIPDPAAQKVALQRVLPEKPRHPGDFEGAPTTVEEAQALLREHFMLKLAAAPFDRADAKLVAKAGSCSACPKRTGSQRELFSDVDVKDDLCTDPKCHRAKVEAHWLTVVEKAKTTKQPVLTEAQAKKVFVQHYGGEWSSNVAHGSGYVRADHDVWLGQKSKKAKAIVGPGVLPTLALCPTGEIVELYPKDVVDKAERSVTRSSSSSSSSASSGSDKALRLKKELDLASKRAVMAAIIAKAEKTPLADTHVRLLVSCFGAREYMVEEVAKRRKLTAPAKTSKQKGGAILTAAATLKGGELLGLLIEVALTFAGERAPLDAAATLYKVDASAVGDKARDEVKAARAEKSKKPASAKAVAKFKTALKAKGVKAKPAPKALPAKKAGAK